MVDENHHDVLFTCQWYKASLEFMISYFEIYGDDSLVDDMRQVMMPFNTCRWDETSIVSLYHSPMRLGEI